MLFDISAIAKVMRQNYCERHPDSVNDFLTNFYARSIVESIGRQLINREGYGTIFNYLS